MCLYIIARFSSYNIFLVLCVAGKYTIFCGRSHLKYLILYIKSNSVFFRSVNPRCSAIEDFSRNITHVPLAFSSLYNIFYSLRAYRNSPVNDPSRGTVSTPISINPGIASLIASSLFIAVHPLDKSIGS